MPSSFGARLLAWHTNDPRPLPWGNGPRSPYEIWVAEVILQQTRLGQGANYLHRFLDRFPDVYSLATASGDDVLRAWEGLGYYARARNLHLAARKILEQHDGVFPDQYAEILALPGVGTYTAAAVASFAFGLPHVVVDGNVKRVIARYAGITDPVDTVRGHQRIASGAQRLLGRYPPAEFNQALMNLGALVCKPSNPACDSCPVRKDCRSRRLGNQDHLPARSARQTLRDRFLHFGIVRHENLTLWVRRTGNDIWKGLYTPPCTETGSVRKPPAKILSGILSAWIDPGHLVPAGSSTVFDQVLSHQHIHARFHYFEMTKRPAGINASEWFTRESLDELPKPRIIHTWLADESSRDWPGPPKKVVRRSSGR